MDKIISIQDCAVLSKIEGKWFSEDLTMFLYITPDRIYLHKRTIVQKAVASDCIIINEETVIEHTEKNTVKLSDNVSIHGLSKDYLWIKYRLVDDDTDYNVYVAKF